MAFFNDLGKKISQTSQDVVKKAKDNSEISKLENAISAEDKKISSIYLQIGKLYYDLHKDSYEPSFQVLIGQIKECEENKARLSAQIGKVRGVKTCPQCGGDIPYESKFCNLCGSTIEEEAPAEEAPATCKSCGSALDGSPFCGNCGTKVE